MVAEVVITLMAVNTIAVIGKPTSWPITWSRSERTKRDRSGMLTAKVDQMPIMPVTPTAKTNHACAPCRREGWSNSGPTPCATCRPQQVARMPTRITSGPATSSKLRIRCTPCETIQACRAQNMATASQPLSAIPRIGVVRCDQAGISVPSTASIAWLPA